jgi:hypothetical protein
MSFTSSMARASAGPHETSTENLRRVFEEIRRGTAAAELGFAGRAVTGPSLAILGHIAKTLVG